MLNQALWDDIEFDTNSFNVDNEVDKNATILNYNGDSWTVEDLNDQLRFHPLVFRKRKMSRGEFPEQLRLAIADLIRDIEITKQCYSKDMIPTGALSLILQCGKVPQTAKNIFHGCVLKIKRLKIRNSG